MNENKINVAWISGSYYLAKSVFDKIKEKTVGIETICCDETTEFTYLLANINSNQCFGTNRLIVVYDLPELTDSEKKKLKTAIENVSSDVLLVFFMIDPSDESAIFNSVNKVGKVYHFEPLVHSSSVGEWIDKRISELNASITSEAKDAIRDNVHYDSKGNANIDILNSILEKLTVYSPGKKEYNITDIIVTSAFAENFIVWDLLKSCDEKNIDKCLNLFHSCVMTNNNAMSALNEVINVLVWKYRLLFFLKERKANNAKIDSETLIKEACDIRKISYIGTGFGAKTELVITQSGPNEGKPASVWSPYVVSKEINSSYGKKSTLELYSRKELYLIIKCLEDCLFLARTCNDNSEAYLISDIIFMTICSSLDINSIKRIQNNLMKIRK